MEDKDRTILRSLKRLDFFLYKVYCYQGCQLWLHSIGICPRTPGTVLDLEPVSCPEMKTYLEYQEFKGSLGRHWLSRLKEGH